MNNHIELHGIVRENIIELTQHAGFPDGQSVTVVVRASDTAAIPGEGLKQSFGGWADDADELDDFLVWNRQQRKQGRVEIEP